MPDAIDEKTLNDLKPYVWGEVAFVLLTVVMAALQIWSMFAIGALLCILAPLWILVVLVAAGLFVTETTST